MVVDIVPQEPVNDGYLFDFDSLIHFLTEIVYQIISHLPECMRLASVC